MKKEKKMKFDIKNLDFDPFVDAGKGSKSAALKDMGVHNQKYDSLEELYTNEFFKDSPDYTTNNDPMSSVLDYDDMNDGDYVLD